MRPMLDPGGVDALRAALAPYTVDAVGALLGPDGSGALDRGDLDAVAYALRTASGPLATLCRLYLLGADVPDADAAAALPVDALRAAGLVEAHGDRVRAAVDIRPHADATHDWWVLSDLGGDVRPGPLAADHVLGVGAASVSLLRAVPRRPVGTALDVGTGSGVQALHLSTHAAHVTATDTNHRALAMAATTAALAGVDWTLRGGSLLEPVAGQRFDLVVANPPFVVSPGHGPADGEVLAYRDSGLPGDGVCQALLRTLPAVLADGATATLLANWVHLAAGPAWDERLAGWLAGSGCDAWIWQREVADPGRYVELWLDDAGEIAGSPRRRRRQARWLDWFAEHGVAAIGLGVITVRNTGHDGARVVCEDVPQPLAGDTGAAIAGWFDRLSWLRAHDDAALLATPLAVDPDVVRVDRTALGRVEDVRTVLRQDGGLGFEVEADDAIAGLVAACTGEVPAGVLLDLLAASLGAAGDEVTAAAVPVLRDLIGRGMLLPCDR